MTTTWSTVSGAVVQSVADAAATSATASATSATAAAASATAASSSATSAASEVALATAQVVLGTAQTALATSQASASATSATASAASLAEFNGIYYGSSGTAPTTSIAVGDIYFNSSSNQLQVYNGSSWQAGVTDTAGLQSVDAGLTSISNLTTAADKMIYTTASDTYAISSLTGAARALLDDADSAAQRTTLGLGTMAVAATSDYLAKSGGTMTGQIVAHSTGVQFSDGTSQTTAPVAGVTLGKAIAFSLVF
tara:strand:+ start:162 stop:920 length:759 start_codon:yes stop_codon:yes gene_type:complete